MTKAIYQPQSGFSDYEIPAKEVTILGFVYGEFEPGYWRSGSKRCTLAVIALEDGSLREAELSSLTYLDAPRINPSEAEGREG